MGLKCRVNRLRSRLVGQGGYLELAGGLRRYYYRKEDAIAAVFLSQMEVGRAGYFGERFVELPELIEAVARATPGSRRGFVEAHGDPFRGPSIVDTRGSRVRHQWCTLKGESQTELLEGEEARDYLHQARGGR